MHNGTPDTAQVIVLPPLVYGAAFIIGLLLHLMLPLHVLPTTLAPDFSVSLSGELTTQGNRMRAVKVFEI